MIRQIAPNLYSVGVVAGDLRTFHGHEMSTPRGTSFNSYLIIDEKETVLVDTVGEEYVSELLDHIRAIVDPVKITAIVSNHSEPDHGGGLAAIKAQAPNAAIICSHRGAESIPGHHHQDWPLRVVKTGDTLDTGRMKLTFFMASMCHWPDSMMTHVGGPDVLLSNDAFGQHYGLPALYDDEDRSGQLWFEAEKYYANIIAPFGRNVLARLDEFAALGLKVNLIAPSHGLIWRRGIAEILAAYRKWASYETAKRVVIAYDTMYESTRRLADAIADGLAAEAVPFNRYHLAVSDRSDVLADIFGSRGLLLGSPTWQGACLPTVASLLDSIKALKFKNISVGAFGSYGWQKASVQMIEQRAADAGLAVPLPGLACSWRPRPADLEAARLFGRDFARAVISS